MRIMSRVRRPYLRPILYRLYCITFTAYSLRDKIKLIQDHANGYRINHVPMNMPHFQQNQGSFQIFPWNYFPRIGDWRSCFALRSSNDKGIAWKSQEYIVKALQANRFTNKGTSNVHGPSHQPKQITSLLKFTNVKLSRQWIPTTWP